MSGDLPSFPPTLQYLGLGLSGNPGNHFTGTLRLNRPIELYIYDNWITDVVIQDSSQIDPNYCELSNNPLLGNPNIAGLTTCTQDGLYSASLLPVTKSTAQLGSTTLLGSSEMTTTSLETTNVATTMRNGVTTMEMTATTRTTNTPLGYSTAQQMSSSEIESGRMLSITMSVTRTRTDTSTSSLGTVQFVQEMSGIIVDLGMMLRCIVSTMLFTFVTSRAPFKREFKKMMSKKKTTSTSSGLEY